MTEADATVRIMTVLLMIGTVFSWVIFLVEEDLEGVGVLGVLGALLLAAFSKLGKDSCKED